MFGLRVVINIISFSIVTFWVVQELVIGHAASIESDAEHLGNIFSTSSHRLVWSKNHPASVRVIDPVLRCCDQFRVTVISIVIR